MPSPQSYGLYSKSYGLYSKSYGVYSKSYGDYFKSHGAYSESCWVCFSALCNFIEIFLLFPIKALG